MDTKQIIWLVGTLTAVISILTKFIGLPDQFRKNYLRKSTEGVSSFLIVFLFLSYSLWTIYGSLTKDWFLVAGHSVGIITTGMIIYQIIQYRKKRL